MRLAALKSRVRAGGTVQKSRRLWTIESIRDDVDIIRDSAGILGAVVSVFETKWACFWSRANGRSPSVF